MRVPVFSFSDAGVKKFRIVATFTSSCVNLSKEAMEHLEQR